MPAAIAVRCPECEKPLKLKGSAAGKRVKCPACGGAVTVPGGSEKAAAKRGGDTADNIRAALPPAPKKPTGLPARVRGGPSTSEIPIPLEEGRKKPKKEPHSPIVVAASIGGGVLVLLLAAGGLGWLIFSSKPIEPPSEMVEFRHDQPRTFRLEIPGGWTTNSGGGKSGTPAFATFEGPGGTFDIRQSRRGSAMGDIGNAVAGVGPGGEVGAAIPDELNPIVGQHEFTKSQTADDYQTYTETDGENFEIAGGGDGRVSEFTASGTFGGSTQGLRATVRIGNETYNVVAKTSPNNFPVMRPVFRKMLESLKP